MSAPTQDKTTAAGYRFGDFQVDVDARKLTRAGEPVPLPSRVYDVLVYLIENRERPVQKDEIITAIWSEVIVTDDSLIHAISVLRRALSDERQNPTYIETIPRRGYRFIAEVTTGSAETAPPRELPPERADRPLPPAAVPAAAPMPKPTGWRRFSEALMVAGLAAAVVAILLQVMGPGGQETAGTASVRLYQPPPSGTSIASGGVLSPDGRYLMFVARDESDGHKGLWVRALQSGEMWTLEGTTGASKPFWAPDSRRLGFFANGQLMTTDINSESLQAVAPVLTPGGAAWNADDRILFAEWASGLYLAPASGDGAVTDVLTLSRAAEDIAFSWPQFFPDNERYLYQVVSLDPGRTGVYVGNLATREQVKLLDTTSPATLAPPRHLLHVRNDMLIAEEFDPQWLELTGRAMVIARGITEPSLTADNIVSASSDLIAFEQGLRQQNLVWYDRRGERLGNLNMPTVLFNPRVSPDGTELLASSSITNNPGLWIASLAREEYARLENDAIAPVWSPDGRHVAFTAHGGYDMKIRSRQGEGASQLLTSDDAVMILNDWSVDGSEILFSKPGSDADLDLWRMRLDDGSKMPLLATEHSESQARLSPDGQWVAYTSDESGAQQVYVDRYPGLGARQQVSLSGGGQPQWQADQQALYFLSSDRAIMSVDVSNSGNLDSTLVVSEPRRLFRPAVAGDPDGARDYFAVVNNGERFLVDNAEGMDRNQGITVIVNWAETLQDNAAGLDTTF